MSLAAFIAAQRAEHGVSHAVACRALGVSQAWFYKWRARGLSARGAPATIGRRGRGDLPPEGRQGRLPAHHRAAAPGRMAGE
ncbi:transposase [Streptosporangium amethystogenes subsp. fukuiense]|uniref:Transposase n=1 Tax=Streptosporangium amethystogenes subsp. fukuiense TaxID=698418 RepID=A0ABW2SW72_9ACTN